MLFLFGKLQLKLQKKILHLAFNIDEMNASQLNVNKKVTQLQQYYTINMNKYINSSLVCHTNCIIVWLDCILGKCILKLYCNTEDDINVEKERKKGK